MIGAQWAEPGVAVPDLIGQAETRTTAVDRLTALSPTPGPAPTPGHRPAPGAAPETGLLPVPVPASSPPPPGLDLVALPGCWSPALSADGRTTAFISDRGGRPQVWLAPSTGGAEPSLVDTGPDPVLHVSWSPDGAWLACLVAPGAGVRTQVWAVRPDGSDPRRLAGSDQTTAFFGGWERDGGVLGLTESVAGSGETVAYLVDPVSGDRRALPVTGLPAVLDVSRNATQVLLRRGPRGCRELVLLDVLTGRCTTLVPAEGSSTDLAHFGPDPSVAYARSDVGRELAGLVSVHVGVDGRAGPVETVAARDDAELEHLSVSTDGTMAALIWNAAGRSELELLDLATRRRLPAPPLPGEVINGFAFSPRGEQLAVSAESPTQPADIWLVDFAKTGWVRVPQAPGQLPVAMDLVYPRLERLTGSDGVPLTGWLYRPLAGPASAGPGSNGQVSNGQGSAGAGSNGPGSAAHPSSSSRPGSGPGAGRPGPGRPSSGQPSSGHPWAGHLSHGHPSPGRGANGRGTPEEAPAGPDLDGRTPTVLWLHGGPEAQERPGFNPLFQALLAQGIAVFAPNVRGSSGFGRTFVNSDNLTGRYGAIADVASCVRHLIEAGVAEPGRVGCMGSSYGGYLTLASLGNHPELFAAGVDICGMADFETFFDRTEPWIAAAAVSKYGDPETDRDLLRDLSPLHRFDRLAAPLLVVHGAQDTNVPVYESEQAVAAARAQGVQTRYLLFPDEGHDITGTTNRQELVATVVSWFREHLGVSGQRPAEPDILPT